MLDVEIYALRLSVDCFQPILAMPLVEWIKPIEKGRVADAVKLIFQEFVEVLKKNGKFDEAAQKEAKEKATKIIMNKLTPELKEFITANYGDISAWVNDQIEVAIYNFKNKVN